MKTAKTTAAKVGAMSKSYGYSRASGIYLSRWLNAGLQYVEPGEIDWDENSFSITNQKGRSTEAQLVSSNRMPVKLVGRKRLPEDFRYDEVRFEYICSRFGDGTPDYLPAKITTLDGVGTATPTTWFPWPCYVQAFFACFSPSSHYSQFHREKANSCQ